MVDRTATAELAKLKNTEAYWELQVRNGKFLPEFSSKYINEKMLVMIEQGKVFTLSQEQIIFRVCVKAPSKLVLVQKLHQYLEKHGVSSGIDMTK